MDAHLFDYGNMLLRWLHVVAAIAWIGESIYFVMLDNSLRPPVSEDDRKRGVFGEMWAVHGGGFYHNQKYLTSPPKLPKDLHWSKWKAYTTWLSGFALFAALYLINPSFYLVKRNSEWAWAASLTGWQAGAVAVLFLLFGWIIYDQLCRRISPNMERDGILSLAVAVMMIIVSYLACQIFPGRAAFLLIGAVMATAMSANVFFWIIPGQKRLVEAMKTGQTPNPLDGKRGKQRSVHNTYFTLPVVLLMLSNHYAFVFSHQYAWIIASLFIISGAAIRQYFVVLHTGKNQPLYPIFGVILLIIVGWMIMPSSSDRAAADQPSATASTSQITISQVRQIMELRCVQCHAEKPSYPGFIAAPSGLALESESDILLNQALIKQVVANDYMPLGNLTDMTTEEREVIANWAPQQ